MNNDLEFLKNKIGHDPLLPAKDLYEQVFERIKAAACHTEENEQFVQRTEDGITFVIQTFVKGDPTFLATSQTHSNGRVDLTITALGYSESNFKYKGEAKIWRGPKYVQEGVEQIINFYSTGRHTRAFLLVYFLGTNTDCFNNFLSELVDLFPPGTLTRKLMERTAQSIHTHVSGSDILLDHVLLWIPEKYQSQTARQKN